MPENLSNQPIVTVENGSLQGSIKYDYKGNPYYSFQGIPYAKTPIGELRFKAPQPPESWTDIRDATKEGEICYSRDVISGLVHGSEDCLFLNVYTPQLPSSKASLKSVMFWIHGGSFLRGSGNSDVFGPEYLINEDVVLVTINYRLGLLGFLSFEDKSLDISGNAGLKDQLMALRWVNKNIIHFGGDPNNVTIFGQSAGSVSVHCFLLSSLAKGLFHKAIMQSGTTLSTFCTFQKCTSTLAVAMGMENSTEKEICEILKRMPVSDLFQLQEKMPTDVLPSTPLTIGPIIESENASMPFLTKNSVEVLRSGHYNHVPLMIGYTSREGLLCMDEGRFLIENCIPSNLKIPEDSDLFKIVCDKIKKFYFGTEETSAENTNQYVLLLGDVFVVHSTYCTIKFHTSSSENPVYLFRMSLDANLNITKQRYQIPNAGACHGDDTGYLFKSSIPVYLFPNSVEDKGVKIFTKLWTQFAKTGNPNSVANDIINVTWKPVEKEKFHFLDIGDNATVGVNPDYNRIQFWDSIYKLNPH